MKMIVKQHALILLFCVASLLLPSELVANESDYWILGSFESIEKAKLERAHLEAKLGFEIQLYSPDSGEQTRLIAPKTKVNSLAIKQKSVAAWLITLADHKSGFLSVANINSDAVLEHKLEPEASGAEQRIEWVRTDETLVDYCARIPVDSLSFCSSSSLAELDLKKVELDVHTERLEATCAKFGNDQSAKQSTQREQIKAVCAQWQTQRIAVASSLKD